MTPRCWVRRTGWLLALPVLTAGCTAERSAEPSPTAAATTPVPSTSAPVELTAAPAATDELQTLLVTDPQSGNAPAGRFSAAPGTLVVSIDCLGAGDLTVDLGTGESYSFPCPADDVFHARNESTEGTARNGEVTVQAPAGVRWALRVEQ